MAFHQPTPFTAPLRHAARHDQQEAITPSTQNLTSISNEWVSQLSDFGSLNTVARTGDYEEDEGIDEDIDEDEELDSLDDGLHAFREPSMYTPSRQSNQVGGSILPAHDGLGTFAASSVPVQEQLWRFEQYNPRRASIGHRRRRTSVQRKLDTVEDDEGQRLENTRVERIEKWRLEQSKVLLEEIEKETRRRRTSRTSEGRQTTPHTPNQDVTARGEQNEPPKVQSPDSPILDTIAEESEPFWQRITRRVIRDLMGINDDLLSVIFGESLPPDENSSTIPPTKSSFPSSSLEETPSQQRPPSKNWEDRLLDRLARELGILIHQLSHSHALPPYSPPNPVTMDYAGIPVTPKPISESPHPLTQTQTSSSSPPQPHFRPTLPSRRLTISSASEHAARWGIEEEEEDTAVSSANDIEYWEHTPDLKTVFGYLQRRFSTQQQLSASSHKPNINIATDRTPDCLRRAAIIRQCHPLVTRPHRVHERHAHALNHTYSHALPHSHLTHTRRSSLLSHHSYSYGGYNAQLSPGLHLKRAGTSCASASTKKSKRDESGASRNYWDIGGSIGSGSAVVGSGGVGVWGEV
ncbi:hypothetical protein MMC30_008509 [Trapelia coarctata]|nr:hypothetical protein [Trapelia coarctata]